MDTPTLAKLGRETRVASAAFATTDVLKHFKKVNELKWGERATLRNEKGELTVQAIEVKHWGERFPSRIARGYNGYVLRREGRALLFGGDTALTPTVGEAKSLGPFEAAIMPIGAYRPWIWNHCDPEQALQMANAAGAKYIVPVHHQTFKLSEEPAFEPIERLQAAYHNRPERLAYADRRDVCCASSLMAGESGSNLSRQLLESYLEVQTIGSLWFSASAYQTRATAITCSFGNTR